LGSKYTHRGSARTSCDPKEYSRVYLRVVVILMNAQGVIQEWPRSQIILKGLARTE